MPLLKQDNKLIFFPLLLVFYEAVNYLANDMYLPALPNIMQDLAINAQQAQFTLTTWFLGTASLQLVLGPLSDRVGRKPVLLAGGIIYMFATFLCALTSNLALFNIGRFLQGCTVCATITAGYASINELYHPKEKVIRILALMGSIAILAPALGPLLGSFILKFAHWRWIFMSLIIITLPILVALNQYMPESCTLQQRQVISWQSLVLSYRTILHNPIFLLNTLVACCINFGLIVWIVAGPFIVMEQFKLSTLIFGIYQILVFSSLTIGAYYVRNKVESWGADKLINVGIGFIFSSTLIATILAVIFPKFLLGTIGALMLYMFGTSLAFSAAQRLAIETSSEPMGARVAVISTAINFANVIASIIVSATYQGTLLWLNGLLLTIAIAACITRWIKLRLY